MAPPKISRENRTLLIELYAQTGSYARACETFAGMRPNEPIPTRSAVCKLVSRWRATGSVADSPPNRLKPATNPQMRASVLAAVSLNPIVTARTLATAAGISRQSVQQILKKEKCRPYKVQHHHMLNDDDCLNRMLFAEDFMDRCNADRTLLENICFSDESTFFLYVFSPSNPIPRLVQLCTYSFFFLFHQHLARFYLHFDRGWHVSIMTYDLIGKEKKSAPIPNSHFTFPMHDFIQ
jgi:hypothetical protein